MNYILLIAGLIILILGGNWLLKAAVSLSLRLEIPKVVIGMTVVSFATSAPELIVSLNSALDGHPDLAIGNVIGSNIANIGLVLGIIILSSTIEIEKSFYKIDWPVMMLSSIILYFFIAFDGVLERYEGAILFLLLIVFLVYLLKVQKSNAVSDVVKNEAILPVLPTSFYLLLGGLCLWIGSELLIEGAVNLALHFGVNERIIGITIVSVGTSIPELTASVVAIIKQEKGISIGNILGSNVFNILAVLGVTSMVTPIQIFDQGLLTNDIIWMLIFTLIVLPLVFTPVKMKLTWKEGLILLGGYLTFITIVML